MCLRTVNLKHAVAAIGFALLLGGPALAASAVDALLDELRDAPAEEAARLTRDIERAWGTSGSAAMDLLLRRGRDAMETGDFKTAIEHFTALTDHAPDFAEGYHARATAYFRADLYGPALEDLEHALALNPQHYNAIFGLGVMFAELGDTRRAALLFRRALEINPHMENVTEALERLKRDGIGRTL